MTISFARHQFPPAVIRHAVWLYMRFTLSYRDVEDLLAERVRHPHCCHQLGSDDPEADRQALRRHRQRQVIGGRRGGIG